MKKFIITITLLLTLAGCAQLDWFYGVDANGQDKEGMAPSDFLTKFADSLGVLGMLGGTLVAAGGSAYVANKKNKDPLVSVVSAIEKVKEDISEEEKTFLVEKLKKHIPDKFHKKINHIKGNL